MAAEEKVPIASDDDIVAARQKGRALAGGMGFSSTDLVLITTAISELARNIVLYAKRGEILLRTLEDHERNGKSGILVVARDDGPGIANVDKAMEAGFSTSGSLGLGLPGVRRLMDEMSVVSHPGQGTIVTAKKWKR